MSVAFRRESDEEHVEPRFELPIPAGRNPVTVRGHRLIEERLAALETALDASHDEATQNTIARDLRYWRTRRATAEITTAPPGEEVMFGRRVRIRMDGRSRTLAIVGADEADPDTHRIGFASPLARALMGAVADDMVAFAGRDDAIEVLEVSDLDDDEGEATATPGP